MSEHEKQKRIELADGVGYAIDGLISRAAEVGGMIWAGDAVQQLQADLPDTVLSPAELAEALIRAAAARSLLIAIQKVE